MTSAIDDTIPINDTPANADPIRSNFEAAKAEIEALQNTIDNNTLSYCRLSAATQSWTRDGGWQTVNFSTVAEGDDAYFSLADKGFIIPAQRAGLFSIDMRAIDKDQPANAQLLEWWSEIRRNGILIEKLAMSVAGSGWSGKGGAIRRPIIRLNEADIITFKLGWWASSDITIPLNITPSETHATIIRLGP